jgi:hypothetical protein
MQRSGFRFIQFMKDKKGITLAEIIVTSAIFMVLLSALVGYTVFAARSMKVSTTTSDSQEKARQIFTYVLNKVHPSYTVNILSSKPGSLYSSHQYFFVQDGYLKHFDGAHTININNSALQNLNVSFTRGISNKVLIVTINFDGLASQYTEQILAENADSSAGSGTSGSCLDIKTSP